MRPEEKSSEKKIHECTRCGERVDDPETRVCDDCGGKLINISRERDL